MGGGNAVDAAVATAFALAVTWPEAGNIGGGGFMLVAPGRGQAPVFIDYRETAPAASTRDMFATSQPDYLMVGVPGTVRGLALAHQQFGKLPWKLLLAPAIKLAENGFAIDAALAGSLNDVLSHRGDSAGSHRAELHRVFGRPGGGEWRAGDRLVQPDLAATLQAIADGGANAFYRGPVADKLVAEIKAGGGIITHEDLAAYQARIRTPIHGVYRGFDIYAPSPPSSGGVALIETLNILEPQRLRDNGRWNPITLHWMTEAMRRAYRDRAEYLGDSDFARVPEKLITKNYAQELAKTIDPDRATPSDAVAGSIRLSDENTTHFSVIDSSGMAVANTYTLEQAFGGKIVVRGGGFLLNNEMGDFNSRPGLTNRKGLIGTEPNLIAPGKRMLSSMTPTIVMRDGRVVLVAGSPGGRTIINTVLCVVLNVIEFRMPLRDAVDTPRMHHQWLPDELRVERSLEREHPEAIAALRQRGHRVIVNSSPQGDAHCIAADEKGGYVGVADQRRSGWAAGY
jgi:gamma-glutamyltranspeptidase/glutathione hydrolase